ncbi:MAG TPA: hypothetical protein VH437_02020 [Terriglobales bacterium]|jgi:glutathione synthase/RimK-type ligase-like ATP-grasp enzyme
MKRIALATSAAYPSLTDDDRTLIPALRPLGIEAEPAIWSDSARDWSVFDCVVLRSCWDYHLRLTEFLRWLAGLEVIGIPVLNPPPLLRWNSDKVYLRNLEQRGISVIPTIWPNSQFCLATAMRELGWQQAVVKPRVSATAYKTSLVSLSDIAEAQRALDDLQASSGALVQKFMLEIRSEGEWSLVFFAGEFSHAVIKTPKAGDFRVQHDFGGLETPAVAPDGVVQDAKQVVQAIDTTPLYARVDGVTTHGRLQLMELELIEPALFLKSSLGAAARFAAAIAVAF